MKKSDDNYNNSKLWIVKNIIIIDDEKDKMDSKNLSEKIKKQLYEFKTPFFLFDLDQIASNVDLFRQTVMSDKFFYAVKCNSLPEVLKTIKDSGGSFEVNNYFELMNAISTGIKPDEVINSSPITSSEDVSAMFRLGVNYFAFDSKSQIEILKRNAPGANVYLRIYSTNEGSKFDLSKKLGATVDETPYLLKYAKDSGLSIKGITFHVGSQCSSPYNWKSGIRECGKIFKKFPELEMINVGGGFPIQYGKEVPSLTDITQVIKDSISENFNKKPIIYAEPGRCIVGDAAIFCTKVTHLDKNVQLSRVVVDGSVFSGLIEIIENENGNGFYYPTETDSNKEKTQIYRISGATCAGTDIIAKEIMLPKLHADFDNPRNSSRLFLHNTGAYTTEYITIGHNSGFNGAKIPDVYFMKDGKIIEK
jgi:ornithine decarboxylase